MPPARVDRKTVAAIGLAHGVAAAFGIAFAGCEEATWRLGDGPVSSDALTACDGSCDVQASPPPSSCDGACDAQSGPGTTSCDAASNASCAPFGNPSVVAELATPGTDIEKPTLCCGMLQMFFLTYNGPGNGDVWLSQRSSTSTPWGAPTLVSAVSTTYRETSPAVSYDGLWLWVASDRPGGQGQLDIWVSNRTDVNGAWSVPVLATGLNSVNDEIPRPPGQHGLVMPISQRMNANYPYQIFTATRPSLTGPWATPIRLSSVDTGSLDDDGLLTDDGLTLYFASDRSTGSQDLFVTVRSSTSRPFGPPLSLDSLNSPKADRDPWVSPDGHEIYFTSDRVNNTYEIYHATR